MSAADDIGLAADAEALNLADEIRRIMADGHLRTTRQIADLSRLTRGGDDVSKTVYLLRMRGELATDVVGSHRLHRLIPGDAPPPRQPAVPRQARQAQPPAPQPPTVAPPAAPTDPAPSPTRRLSLVGGSAAPGGAPQAGDQALQMAIDDSGALALLRGDDLMLELDAGETRRLADFLHRTRAVWATGVDAR